MIHRLRTYQQRDHRDIYKVLNARPLFSLLNGDVGFASINTVQSRQGEDAVIQYRW